MVVNTEFDRRTRRVVRRHRAMNLRGVKHKIGRDGLIRSSARARSFNPLRLVLPVLLWGFAFKGYTYHDLGAEAYEARIAMLAEGNLLNQAGAFLMQPEGVTLWIASQFGGGVGGGV